eukprot:TRINITY_DN2757_c0_g1_i1.p1 TRINITY_DN2757_c0_g1~~TRINITY_DN2757_c0_g1_i1.p1  ORF type:complete len:333 (+),score=90.44 TRINITY_DN2757_c0_g1_i1:149-1000(+)
MDGLSEKGFRCIAPDQRGFGETLVKGSKEQFRMEVLVKDIIALLDALSIPKAILIGHDWGSVVVWTASLAYPDRIAAVASYVVPFFPSNPKQNPMEKMRKDPGLFDYQMYFQDIGVAEKEFEADPAYSIKCIVRSAKPIDRFETSKPMSLGNVRERGGMLVGFPKNENLQWSVMFQNDDASKYASTFRNSGFGGGFNWYRNIEENWNYTKQFAGKKIEIPALMITVGKDRLFPAKSSQHMESWVTDLTRGHVESGGHWIEEEPEQLNQILLNWLTRFSVSSKL